MQYYQLEAGNYNKANLSLYTPATKSIEEALWFWYGHDAPATGLAPDWFAGLMDFWVRIDEPGEYQFHLNADDRVWLWLDGWTPDAPAEDGKAISGML